MTLRTLPCLAALGLPILAVAAPLGLPPVREPTCPGIPAWSGLVAVRLVEEGLRFEDEEAHGWRVLLLSPRNRVFGPSQLDDLREELRRDVLVEGRCFVPAGEEERRRVQGVLPPERRHGFLVLDPEGAVVDRPFSDARDAVRRAGALARATGARDGRPAGAVHREATLEGRRVAYLDAGRGEPAIVLVHGWASDSRSWVHQLDPLSRRHRVIAVDLPGHGRSGRPAAEYSTELFAAGIGAVLDDAGVSRAVLVGHSNGTPAVRRYQARHPDRVAGLVVVDGPLKRMMSAEAAAPHLAAFRSEDWRERVAGFVDSMPASDLSESDRARIREMALAQPQHAVVGGLVAAVADETWTDGRIEGPCLVLLAAQPAWTAEYEAEVRRLVPDVDYRTWAGVSHFLQFERAADFNALVEDFVAGLQR